jgi:hypothetical protein
VRHNAGPQPVIEFDAPVFYLVLEMHVHRKGRTGPVGKNEQRGRYSKGRNDCDRRYYDFNVNVAKILPISSQELAKKIAVSAK